MQIPGVHLETLKSPGLYTPAQIDRAIHIAAILNRGKLVIVEAPEQPNGAR